MATELHKLLAELETIESSLDTKSSIVISSEMAITPEVKARIDELVTDLEHNGYLKEAAEIRASTELT